MLLLRECDASTTENWDIWQQLLLAPWILHNSSNPEAAFYLRRFIILPAVLQGHLSII